MKVHHCPYFVFVLQAKVQNEENKYTKNYQNYFLMLYSYNNSCFIDN